ncbi:hypothetical protein F511_24970 [Dorcoceras hygrometricum]|uniref:Uncharacterized protein n=1 Tax=Dorcoceras hygrometricum TaxID=472368 RepID=A0A2Z7AP02_9LAMI|nr:hypothetical protein F511_24970 [Dorcoceras hygrometricum]
MVVDSIGIYELKGSYYTLTMTDWFLQALSVIPRGSWGDVARRFTMIAVDYRQSGPRPNPRFLRQAALEALTRSARTNTPRKTRPERFPAKWRRRAAHGGGVSWEGREAATIARKSHFPKSSSRAQAVTTSPERRPAAAPPPPKNSRRQARNQQHASAGHRRTIAPACVDRGVQQRGGTAQIAVDYRQSGPRPNPRFLRQAALEALTRSARMNTPRKTRPERFPAKWRRRAAHGGGVSWEGREAATIARKSHSPKSSSRAQHIEQHQDFTVTPITDQIGPIDSVSETEYNDLKNHFSEPQCKMTVLPLNSGKPRFDPC